MLTPTRKWLTSYDIQNYNKITYTLAYKHAPSGFQMASAFSDKYDFKGALDTLNGNFATYSKHVVEGKDVADEAQSITDLFAEIINNIALYGSNEDLQKSLTDPFRCREQYTGNKGTVDPCNGSYPYYKCRIYDCDYLTYELFHEPQYR